MDHLWRVRLGGAAAAYRCIGLRAHSSTNEPVSNVRETSAALHHASVSPGIRVLADVSAFEVAATAWQSAGRVTSRSPPPMRTVAASMCQQETRRQGPLASARARQRTPQRTCDYVPTPRSAPTCFAWRPGVAGFAAARPLRADRATTAPVRLVCPAPAGRCAGDRWRVRAQRRRRVDAAPRAPQMRARARLES